MLFKNLYVTNNLEQWRNQQRHADGDAKAANKASATEIAACFVQPKVIITTRSELLARNPDYAHSFLALEAENKSKDEDEEAREYFDEIRIEPAAAAE